MSIKDITTNVVRVIGYFQMIVSAYMLGDIWWAVFIAGFIAWMPPKWLTK